MSDNGKEPRVLSQVPGRLRVHLPAWGDEHPDWVEARLRAVPGVEAARANPLTRNVLVRFNPRLAQAPALLAALREEGGTGEWRDGRTNASSPVRPASALLRVGTRAVLGHAVVDAAWFGAGFLGRSAGLPLAAWLGPLHLLADVAVWGAALSAVRGVRAAGGASAAVTPRPPARPGVATADNSSAT